MMFDWTSTTIASNQDARDMVALFKSMSPRIGGFDTETTGLHIICDKPFLFQFGWVNFDTMKGYTFAVDIERQPQLAHQVITAWHRLAATLEKYLAHNVKYDMHMVTNIGLPYMVENLSDTMFYIRYASDAIPERNGGVPLALKEFGARFICREAAVHEKLLQQEQSSIAKVLNQKLKIRLGKGWTLKRLEEFFDDQIHDAGDLDIIARQAYNTWLYEDVPEEMRHRITGKVESEDVPYNMLNRGNVIRYAHFDIILLLETFCKLEPILKVRQNEFAVALEESLVLPLYEMEREGFDVDHTYLENVQQNMKNYIIQRREYLYNLIGQPIKLGQHEVIKSILELKMGITMASTRAEELTRTSATLKHTQPGHPAIAFIDTVQELRTLEKWYAVYLMRFKKNLRRHTKLFTTIQQVGAVTGRVTSDFQQFPRKGIKTYDGQELFTPRKLVVVPEGDYDGIVYIDYSQIELRLQAMYTILVGHPEPNLCRAYMPYDCVDSTGRVFDYTKLEDILNWKGEWFLRENPDIRWSPVDVHAATTCFAFNITPDHPDFKVFRSDGKTLNFAKNYGAKRGRVREMFPEKSEDEIDRIDSAYYKAFPGVKYYHDYCYALMDTQSHAVNLFGVRYYNASGHNLINMLVQGSGASLMKLKIRETYDYCKANGIKSRFQMNIHDELSWKKHKDDGPEVFFAFKKIMEDWPDTYIPIVAEMALTRTTWANKKDIKEVADFENA